MRRRLPSLNALKAFEATARQESFTKAAHELCVTQGAVSQQVKGLESDLGVRLFRRERQRLVITDAGRAYLEVVCDALDRLAMSTERLLQREKSGTLTITTSPNFAAKWLVHRLGQFSEAHPGIDSRISASVRHIDFPLEDIDLAIRHGDGQWSGMHVTRLCMEELFPVCSPKLLTGRSALDRHGQHDLRIEIADRHFLSGNSRHDCIADQKYLKCHVFPLDQRSCLDLHQCRRWPIFGSEPGPWQRRVGPACRPVKRVVDCRSRLPGAD
jgi:DNA-binding transcriptional LysR family regulator